MACPGGCVGGRGGAAGGGRPAALPSRLQGIWKIDAEAPIRASHENPDVQRLYEDFWASRARTWRTIFFTAVPGPPGGANPPSAEQLFRTVELTGIEPRKEGANAMTAKEPPRTSSTHPKYRRLPSHP